MSNVVFNWGARKMPTPASINLMARGTAIFGSVLITGINTAPFPISHSFREYSTWFISIAIGLANGLAPLFGVQTTQERVNVSDVSVLDENAVKK